MGGKGPMDGKANETTDETPGTSPDARPAAEGAEAKDQPAGKRGLGDPTGRTRDLGDTAASTAPLAVPSPQPGPAQVDPSLGDVGRTAGAWLRGRAGRIGGLLASHRLVAALCAAVLVLLVGAVVVAGGTLSAPSEKAIASDALALAPVPARDPGTFGTDAPYQATRAQVVARGTDGSDYGAEAEVTFSNGAVEARETVRLSYAKDGSGTWQVSGCTVEQTPTFSATAGVDQDQVASKAGVEALLDLAQRRESQGGESQGEGGADAGPAGQADEQVSDRDADLLDIYQGAGAKVTAEAFDGNGQTDLLQVHLEKASTFTSYACDLTARFSFDAETALWKLEDVDVSDGAAQAGFGPLVGTWTGTFANQEATRAKCLGAKGQPLALSIQNVSAKGFTGTLTTLAHFHPAPDQDADATEGDAILTDLAVTGRLNEEGSGSGAYVFDLDLPDDSRGTVSCQVTFGTQADPTAAVATVSTDYSYQQTFLLIPYTSQATYTDSYALTKE